MTTTKVTTQRVKDPWLGYRWIVNCPWHGAVGRYKFEDVAKQAATRHDKCEVTR